MKLPLKLSLALSQMHEDDTAVYELTVTVPGTDRATTIVMIGWTPEGKASVTHVSRNGLDALADDLRDGLLIRLFKLAWGEMVKNDGTAIEWWVSDVSRLVKRRFEPNDAAVLSAALKSFVNSAVAVEDMTIVRID